MPVPKKLLQQLQVRHRRNHSSLLSSLEANPSCHVRGNQTSDSDVKRASVRQPGQTLGREIQSHVKAKPVQRSTQACSHRPQVVRLQTKGVLMGLSRAYFSLLNNIWALARLCGAGKLASFWPCQSKSTTSRASSARTQQLSPPKLPSCKATKLKHGGSCTSARAGLQTH